MRRRLLLTLALAAAAALALNAAAHAQAVSASAAPGDAGRVAGHDARTATAAAATEAGEAAGSTRAAAATEKTVVLTDPSISLGGSRMGAKTAAFHLDDGMLILQGDVAFDDGEGSKLTADQAIVDTKAGVVRGEKATNGGSGVHVEGPMGDIRADAYAVTDQGKRIIRRGRVHGRVTSRGKR